MTRCWTQYERKTFQSLGRPSTCKTHLITHPYGRANGRHFWVIWWKDARNIGHALYHVQCRNFRHTTQNRRSWLVRKGETSGAYCEFIAGSMFCVDQGIPVFNANGVPCCNYTRLYLKINFITLAFIAKYYKEKNVPGTALLSYSLTPNGIAELLDCC